MVVQAYLNLKVGDPVKFQVVDSSTGGSGTGTLPAGLTAGTTYYVKTYTASSGAMTVSATNGGSAVNLTDVGTAAAPNEFEVYYNDYASVGQVQSWSFEVTRSEIDVTTIGQTVGQYAPFKTYISGFADGNGSASVYVTDEDAALSNRLVEDVLQRQQVGAAFRLYQDKQATEALSRSISMDAVLLSASFSVNPDDAQMVEVAFRPNNAPTFDLSTSS
jgi:N-acetylmuramoyl-L-alanine amidase